MQICMLPAATLDLTSLFLPWHDAKDKAWISPMCLASHLQFHYYAFWQMPAIRTMWSLTICPPCQIDTEAKQSMENCQTRCQCVARIVPGLLESTGRWAVCPNNPITLHVVHKQDGYSLWTQTYTYMLNSSGMLLFLLTNSYTGLLYIIHNTHTYIIDEWNYSYNLFVRVTTLQLYFLKTALMYVHVIYR